MRKSACILILSLLALCVSAQPRMKAPEYWVGVHGGVTGSTVLFTPDNTGIESFIDRCVLGGNAGVVFRFAAHKYCHFQMELNYMHRGWNDTIGVRTKSLHYVELPILMNLNFGSETCRWIFNLGPQIGYCVWEESGSITNRFNWGLAAGTGFYVRTKNAGVYELEIRYDFSFGGVYGTGVTDYYSMANPMDLSINLGWYWPIHSKKYSK